LSRADKVVDALHVGVHRIAACRAHLRRDFFDVRKETGSELAREALKRIGALYDIEAGIAGRTADERHAVRHEHSHPKVDAFRVWAEAQLEPISGKSDLARAVRHALNRWPSFCLFLDDGRVAMDNNPAERAMRPIGIGRKNWLFAGSDAGGETLARAMTLIGTARMNGLNPQACLGLRLRRPNRRSVSSRPLSVSMVLICIGQALSKFRRNRRALAAVLDL